MLALVALEIVAPRVKLTLDCQSITDSPPKNTPEDSKFSITLSTLFAFDNHHGSTIKSVRDDFTNRFLRFLGNVPNWIDPSQIPQPTLTTLSS